jgi:hypothetical protein
VALAGPRREQKEDLGACVAPHRVALVGLEVGECPRRGLDLLAARSNVRLPVDDEQPGVLLDLVVAEFLPRLEADQDRASLVLAHQDHRRAAPRGRVDPGQMPAFHGGAV